MKRIKLGDDRGIALVTVLGVSLVLSLLVIASTVYAVASQKNARRDQDWHAALAAAQAGVDEYISHLNQDGNYWRYGNPAAPYSTGSSVTLPSPPNPAFLGWMPVDGSGGRAKFRYDVNNSSFMSQGIIKLQATGRVGKRTRTVEVNIRRTSFLDFLYFTDYETKDPALYVKGTNYDQLTPAEAQVECAKHWYEGRRDEGLDVGGRCVPVSFGNRDQINGPMHTNDTIVVCGSPKFHDVASTSWRSGRPRYRINSTSGCGAPVPQFRFSGDPRFQPNLELPPSVNTLKREVDTSYTATPGCLYVGPTKIVLNGNGTMNVTNGWTKPGGPAWCGTGPGRPLPANGVIYVEDVPTPADASTLPEPSTPCRVNGNSVGYPVPEDITTYGCTTGDVFIEGTLRGALTVAAENNVIVTWHLDYATGTTGTDILGLVANNYVQVYHPVRCISTGYGACDLGVKGSTRFKDARISAAMLALNHSFLVQNSVSGERQGLLSVTGSIAQRYRGIVGVEERSGFDKNYVYDPRLRYASPPRFPAPLQSAYIALWAEPPPAYPASAP